MRPIVHLAAAACLIALPGCAGRPTRPAPAVAAGFGAPLWPYATPLPLGNWRMQRAANAYYLDHPVEREAQVTQCRQERGATGDLRCVAASQAEQQEQAREQAIQTFGIFGGTTGAISAPRFN